MTPTHLTVTTNMPEPPSADFAFRVDFKRGEGPASRVFAATHAFIKACEAVDLELVTSVDANINPVMVLEDVEAGSLKTFLKTVLESTDNQAIKELDWKPAVGKYLVKAKYLILRWIETDDNNRDLQSLRRDIHTLAEATDVRHIPAYAPPSSSALITAIRDFDAVKTHLVVGDEAAMIVSDDEVASFNISSRIDITSLESLATRETQVHSVPSMVLVVKRPDYLGNSQWDFQAWQESYISKDGTLPVARGIPAASY